MWQRPGDLARAPAAEVEIAVVDGSRIVTAVAPQGMRLQDLRGRVTANELHEELDFGPAEGSES